MVKKEILYLLFIILLMRFLIVIIVMIVEPSKANIISVDPHVPFQSCDRPDIRPLHRYRNNLEGILVDVSCCEFYDNRIRQISQISEIFMTVIHNIYTKDVFHKKNSYICILVVNN